ncbi:2Fe-2S iron-sulfur cluster-binding protein [Actinophytocola xanthii]|uniref:(2Fe-2S)-binding protein n=1 Tax=Actinophytocola xanthii TaxID=1912961 RepID=A0A1Q8CQY6_9PSEU|nr:2Fe-2S iron-sulfur cluster-binding protein [Actinophytocola xanthii]OLF16775.1 (2Fe-2S)-binding protein [Actinophytocola xanthii]
MVEIRMRVNGAEVSAELEARVSLLDALRVRLGVTGPKKGCDQGACGACTVLVDGRRILSCLALAVQYDGSEVTTIEGVDHPLQAAFVRHDGFQCGYCTPGQICSAIGMLAEHAAGAPSAATEHVAGAPALTRTEIRERMSGNLCRCGAYNGIVAAIEEVAP